VAFFYSYCSYKINHKDQNKMKYPVVAAGRCPPRYGSSPQTPPRRLRLLRRGIIRLVYAAQFTRRSGNIAPPPPQYIFNTSQYNGGKISPASLSYLQNSEA